MKAVNSDNFAEVVLNSDKPVLVDFWAEWCGPCKALGPILEEVSQEVAGKVEARDLATKYGIRGIPTMMMFKNGEVSSTLVGNQPKAEILKLALS